jgi:hypothetical protein
VAQDINFTREDLFSETRYRHFRKGDLYRDPRITPDIGSDFLVMEKSVKDMIFLEQYLQNKLPKYPAEKYNAYSTGLDVNKMPKIQTFWAESEHDKTKRAVILCKGGCEFDVLAIVDKYCQTFEEPEQPKEASVEYKTNGYHKLTLGQNRVRSRSV